MGDHVASMDTWCCVGRCVWALLSVMCEVLRVVSDEWPPRGGYGRCECEVATWHREGIMRGEWCL